MIISNISNNTEIIGEDSSKKATISATKMAKLQYLLTKGLYKDPISATIVEWTNNGVDSVIQAGKNPIENPVVVTIKVGGEDTGQYIFSVEDKGTGLDDKDFEDICMNYLESTKDSSNECIGSFGIGMKSFLSLSRAATFTCRKNGKERVYMVYEGEEFVNYQLIKECDTDKENGVIAELVIKNYSERCSFIDKMKRKLAYYDTVVMIIDNNIISNKIYRNELFQWSSFTSGNTMHLCLKDVYYEIDWTALGINPIYIPIALRFSLEDGITPTPSRESYITNEHTKELILNKIKESANWFVDKYNETTKTEYDTLMQAYESIGKTTYNISILGTNMEINPLLRYANKSVNKIKIKEVSFYEPQFYKSALNHLLWEVEPVGEYNYMSRYSRKTSSYSLSTHIITGKKVVRVAFPPFGNIKEYLKSKYHNVIFVIYDENKRKLGSSTDTQKFESYKYILSLHHFNKCEYRDRIKEFKAVRDSITNTFADERDVTSSKEYLDWLENKRKIAKESRISNPGMYNILNKQKGDVTIGYMRCKRVITFPKKAYPVKDICNNHFLTVYTNEADDTFKDILAKMNSIKYIKFAVIGTKEEKKIQHIKQFIKFDKFMETKPFSRLASAIMFSRLLSDYNILTHRDKQSLVECVSKIMKQDADILKVYVKENLRDTSDDTIDTWILDTAKEHNLFDKRLWDVYERLKENIKKYDFLTVMESPSYFDEESIKKYKRVTAQLLLFRKKYYNDLPEDVEIEIKFKEKVSDEKIDEAEESEFDEEGETNENDFVEEEITF